MNSPTAKFYNRPCSNLVVSIKCAHECLLDDKVAHEACISISANFSLSRSSAVRALFIVVFLKQKMSYIADLPKQNSPTAFVLDVTCLKYYESLTSMVLWRDLWLFFNHLSKWRVQTIIARRLSHIDLYQRFVLFFLNFSLFPNLKMFPTSRFKGFSQSVFCAVI